MRSYLTIFIAACVISTSAQAMSISVESDRVVVSGVSVGARVVILSIESTPSPRRQFLIRKRANQLLRDDDRDGIVAFAPSSGQVGYGTFWAAVDLHTGSTAIVASDWQSVTLDGRGFDSAATPGVLNRLATSFHFIEALVVRPGEGAWILTSGDGSPHQEGPPGRGVRLPVSQFATLEGDQALQRILPRDTVVLIEPARFRYFASEGVGR